MKVANRSLTVTARKDEEDVDRLHNQAAQQQQQNQDQQQANDIF